MSQERVPPTVASVPDEGAPVPDEGAPVPGKGALVRLVMAFEALALFVGLTTYQLALPGLHYDEAFEAVPAMQLLLGQPVTSFRDNGLLIAGRLFPLMTQDYIGAINTYAALPFFWLLGVNLISLRLMAVAIGLITLCLMHRLARDLYGPAAAALAVLLLAVNPTFVFWSRQGVFVTSITAAIGLAAALAWLRWARTGAGRYAIAGAFFFGLGLYAKFLFLWLIAALALAGLLLGWLPNSRSLAPRGRRGTTGTPAPVPQVQARPYTTRSRMASLLERRALVGCLVALLLGAAPLILYNLQTGGTLRSVGGNLTTSYYGTNNLAFWPNLLERLNQFGAVLSGSHFWYLGGTYANPLSVGVFLAALAGALWLAVGPARAEASVRAEAWRALLPFAVVGGTILASCATVSALWVTHFAILMPWPSLAVAAVASLALRRLSSGEGLFHRGARRDTARRVPRLGAILVVTVAGALWLGDAITDVRYHQALAVSGGLGAHSDAVEDLARWLTAGGRQGAPVVAMDWGIAAPVTFLTRGAVTPAEAFGYAWETDADFAARLSRFVGDPASIYLWRAPDEIIFNRSADFQRLYRPLGLEEDILEAFYERSGRPVLGATRLVPAGTAVNPPRPAGSN
jgi:hypothetical protein